MLSIASGYSVKYLTDAVATGRENYYSQAVEAGEPPGRWYGRGAERLGLAGEVDHDVIAAVYSEFLDPRDARFADAATRAQADRLPGLKSYRFATPEEALQAALVQEPDATPERVEQLRLEAENTARQAVAFHDVTFSVQKSVTVLHTAFEAQEVAARRGGDAEAAQAWATHREAVEEAIWAGNRAALDYLSDVAGYARVGHHGPAGGRYVDAHDWVVSSFFQHTSRENDPQLHIHNALLNRVECPDGKWRTLDGRALYRHRGAAAAVAERTTEEHLTRTLGVRFAMRPDGKAREVVGIRQEVLELFSARRRAVTDRTRVLVGRFEQRYGRAPTTLELDKLQRSATLQTRPGKLSRKEAEDLEARLDRWSAQLRDEIDTGMAEVARDALGHVGDAPAESFSPAAVIETALAEVQESKATWTRSDLMRAINAALPDSLGGLEGPQVQTLIRSLTNLALRGLDGEELAGGAQGPHGAAGLTFDVPVDGYPPELQLADGRPAYEPSGGWLFATVGQLAAERALREAAVVRGRPAAGSEQVTAALEAYRAATGVELGADQAAAVRGVLSSGAAVEVLIGPAGTGKSRTVGALAAAWSDPNVWPDRPRPPRVVGLAASQIAADVLAGEGLDAANIARWLAAQDRLAGGARHPTDERWRLGAGDLVVVDEAAMADTRAITEVHRRVEAAGAKLLLTGDHRQLAAVGAGGAFDLVARHAATYELAEVRRFAAEWEADASLRLREGDPSAVIDYARHGRLVDGGTSEQATIAARVAWLGDTLGGRRSVLLVDSNEQAAAASAQARAELVRLGLVDDEQTVTLERDGNRAGVGDLVQARKLAPRLAGYAGNTAGPVNRECYRVTAVDSGELVVAPITGHGTGGAEQLGAPMRLPASYVAEHVVLGYAATVHCAQGLTVDTSHTVITPSTSAAAAYVGLTRGRDENTAYVTTLPTAPDAPAGEAHDLRRRDPAAVVAEVLARDEADPAALMAMEQSAEQARSLATVADRNLAQAGEMLAAGRHAAAFDRLADRGLLSAADRQALAADSSTAALSQLLRTAELAGHDLDQVLAAVTDGRPLDGARSVAQVLHRRISTELADQLTPAGDTFADRIPADLPASWADYVTELAAAADERRQELGGLAAEQAPQWAVEPLGPVPEDPQARPGWEHRAGVVAAYREMAGHHDPTQSIGPAPGFGAVDRRAAWHAAWRALGRPEAGAEEAELSNGALRVRVRAYQREDSWAPPWVGEQLATTARQTVQHRQYAAISRAEAAAAADEQERAAALQRAEHADQLAETLAEQQRRLEVADHARGAWYAHTAVTRASAERAKAELAHRGVPLDDPDGAVTAEQWLAVHTEHTHAEDPHRLITPTDIAHSDGPAQHQPDEPEARTARAAAKPEPATDEVAAPAMSLPPGVPSLDDTAGQVQRAQEALAHLADRRDHEVRRQADEDTQHAELAAWRDQTRASTPEPLERTLA